MSMNKKTMLLHVLSLIFLIFGCYVLLIISYKIYISIYSPGGDVWIGSDYCMGGDFCIPYWTFYFIYSLALLFIGLGVVFYKIAKRWGSKRSS